MPGQPQSPRLGGSHDRVLCYEELLRSACTVAGLLRERNIGPGQRVAVCLERGIDAVVAVFGVLLAGACYVPLDTRNPPDRLSYIVRDAGVAAVLGGGAARDWFVDGVWLDLSSLQGPGLRGQRSAFPSGGHRSAVTGCHPLHVRFHRPAQGRGARSWGGYGLCPLGRRTARDAT